MTIYDNNTPSFQRNVFTALNIYNTVTCFYLKIILVQKEY